MNKTFPAPVLFQKAQCSQGEGQEDRHMNTKDRAVWDAKG